MNSLSDITAVIFRRVRVLDAQPDSSSVEGMSGRAQRSGRR
jgi:hypothetical protein